VKRGGFGMREERPSQGLKCQWELLHSEEIFKQTRQKPAGWESGGTLKRKK